MILKNRVHFQTASIDESTDLIRIFNISKIDSRILKIPVEICDLLSVPVCILWKQDKASHTYKIVAAAGDVDEEYRQLEIDEKHPGVQYLLSHPQGLSLSNVTQPRYRLAYLDELKKRRWISLLSIPLKANEEIIGIVDVFTKQTHAFNEWEINLLKSLSSYFTIVLYKTDFLAEKKKN